MEEIILDVQIRNEVGGRKASMLRRQNFVPAIVYGAEIKPTPIKINRRAYEHIRRLHEGASLVFHLNVMEGENKLKDYSAIIKEEQHHPVTAEILHIDFNRISLKQKIMVKVHIVAKGEAIGVKRDGGSLEHVLWELDVVCLPTQIPQHLDVDVSRLTIGDSVYVKDIILPEGVNTKHDLNGIVFTVVPPMKAEEAVAAAEAPAAEPEVLREKKDKEEAEKKAAPEGKEKKVPEGKEKSEEKTK